MAALDFPLVPNTESEVTTGDITWKWNGYAWYAASQGDDVYLSKVTDDEAAGAITFKALTTHEDGVYAKGGPIQITAVNTRGFSNFSDAQNANWGGNQAAKYYATGGSATIGSAGFVAHNLGHGTGADTYYFQAKEPQLVSGKRNIAFFTDWDATTTGEAYAFYSDGDAPSSFGGLTVHEGGVSVTGTPADSSPDDSIYPLIKSADRSSGKQLTLNPRSADATKSVSLSLLPPQSAGEGGGVTITHNKTLDGNQTNNLRIKGTWSGDYTVAGGSTTSFNSYLLVQSNLTGATTSADKPVTGIGVGCNPDGNDFVGIISKGKTNSDPPAASWIGVKSAISNADATEAYNFYAGGDAPNYFRGGVQFDNAAGTSALSNYEEGEWTPIFSSASGAGSAPTCTYDPTNGQYGRYVRVGKQITAFFHLKLTAASGGSGVLIIGGLPFDPVRVEAGVGTGGASLSIAKNFSNTTDNVNAINLKMRASNSLEVIGVNSNGDYAAVQVNRLTNTTHIIGNIVYITN